MEIFISHASENKPLIRKFRSHLPNHIKIWIDQDALDLGVRIPAKLETAIKEEVKFFILFFDKHAIDSSWVAQEIDWALDREDQLSGPFILPILLQSECLSDYQSSRLSDKLYLECYDHSDEGIENSSKKLADSLFALISRQFGTEKISVAKDILEALSYDLTRFKELAFMLQASLGDSIALIATSDAATTQLIHAITEYNEFTVDLMQRLSTHNTNVKKRFGNNLGEQCAALLQFLEKEVYRGQVFALNHVRDSINKYQLLDNRVNFEQLSKWDQEKKSLLAETQLILEKLTDESTSLVGALEKEL